LLSAGNILESPCENLIFEIGAAIIPRITKERTIKASALVGIQGTHCGRQVNGQEEDFDNIEEE
jgi:hypothetical protein